MHQAESTRQVWFTLLLRIVHSPCRTCFISHFCHLESGDGPQNFEKFETPQNQNREACMNTFWIKQRKLQKLPSGADETRASFPASTTFTPRTLVSVHIS